jgi:xylose isomerase
LFCPVAADLEVRDALRDSRTRELAEPTVALGKTWRDVRDVGVAADMLGRRGKGCEPLDQLALEHLYGVH